MSPSPSASTRMLVALLVSIAPWCNLTSAQKMSRNWHEDTSFGFRFQTIDEFEPVPIQTGRSTPGLVGKYNGPEQSFLGEDGSTFLFRMELLVYAFTTPQIKRAEDQGSTSAPARLKIGEVLVDSVKWFTKDMVDAPEKTKEFKSNGFDGMYQEWAAAEAPGHHILATYTFRMDDVDVVIVYSSTESRFKKYSKSFNKSVKTLVPIPRKKALEASGNSKPTYEELLAIAEEDCAKTLGWMAMATPSKRFIIKTSSDDKGFLKAVISRLEISRDIFEKDFPPPASLDAVSIVRICSDAKEFSSYGNTRPGVAGWFSPGTKELVLYDSQNTNRSQTFAVMSHEAFHQYCHYIFDQSEAHRWFDEGHGDYYGGIEINGQKTSITKKMPGGLNRYDEIKEMLRAETYAPLAKHLNFNHSEWQNQGPSNVSGYAQSWSIIYMLRSGSEGKLKKKYWDESYANIIPNYVSNLKTGYFQARSNRFEKANDKTPPLELDSMNGQALWNSIQISDTEKAGIWKQAMDASWGQIDLFAFEAHWLLFLKEVL